MKQFKFNKKSWVIDILKFCFKNIVRALAGHLEEAGGLHLGAITGLTALT